MNMYILDTSTIQYTISLLNFNCLHKQTILNNKTLIIKCHNFNISFFYLRHNYHVLNVNLYTLSNKLLQSNLTIFHSRCLYPFSQLSDTSRLFDICLDFDKSCINILLKIDFTFPK
jgi:hypothetical protein